MTVSPEVALELTWAFCVARNWTGMDPYDGLMVSRWPATTLLRSRLGRLALTQGMKRSPVNLRRLLGVPPLKNPKALALGLEAACQLSIVPSWRERAVDQARSLVGQILDMSTRTPNGYGWGYPFDWQSRVFFLRRGVPTVVCTGFVVRALSAAQRLLAGESELCERIQGVLRGAARFVLHDLQRTEDSTGFCWSYSPLDRSQVVNATLLGAEVVARVAALDGDRALFEKARPTLSWSLARRRPDGGWLYGSDASQQWEDGFHTGFNLLSYLAVRESAEALGLDPEGVIDSGGLEGSYRHYVDAFVGTDGRPWYYRRSPFPIDAHAAAVALLTLLAFRERFSDADARAQRVLDWTLEHLWLAPGYFRFQIGRFYRINVPYIRWSQAWMLRALAEWKRVALARAAARSMTLKDVP